MLAEAYGQAGQPEEGLTLLAEALATEPKTRKNNNEPEANRLKGKLLLAQEGKKQRAKGKRKKESRVPSPESRVSNTQAEAEACVHKAVDTARRRDLKSLELRAVTSLSRLWQKQGKKVEARQMLAEVYGWFTEGFDTVDLKDAKALLEELGEA